MSEIKPRAAVCMSKTSRRGAYYNEFDKSAAAWLRELVLRGLIADGDVDDRSIVDVRASEVRGYTQYHWMAGIGVWSYALRKAGWPDDRPVMSASLPCQPFSAAGAQRGLKDERHLWPVFYELFKELRPPVLFGEQVSSKDAMAWWDVVKGDLNASGYATVAADIPASAFGAPHIRQRLYFVSERQGA